MRIMNRIGWMPSRLGVVGVLFLALGLGARHDNAGIGVVLRRVGAEQECIGHHRAESCDSGVGQFDLGPVRVQFGIWA